jgi:hypothetical protein
VSPIAAVGTARGSEGRSECGAGRLSQAGCSVLRLLGAFQQLCQSFAESELPWTNIILSRVRIRSWVGRECG